MPKKTTQKRRKKLPHMEPLVLQARVLKKGFAAEYVAREVDESASEQLRKAKDRLELEYRGALEEEAASAADEVARQIADEQATEAAEEAYEEAYREAYEEAYRVAFEEEYRLQLET